MLEVSNTLLDHSTKIVSDFKLKVNHFLLAAFTFVAALSWNDTIKAGIEELYPKDQFTRFSAKLLYSVVLTFVIVVIMLYVLNPDTQTSVPRASEYFVNKNFYSGNISSVRNHT